jgi:hypothetical protein
VPARGNDRRSTGRRGIDTEAARLRETLRAPQMRQLPLVEEAMGRQALALLGRLHATCAAADDLEQATIVSSPAIRRRQRGTCVLGHVSGTVI